jgi:DNA repair exonuclease SbcCD nuclease subunit
MKLVLFGDLHLDAHFAWLGVGQEAARRRRQALRDALRNILAVVHETQADALLCSGDLYEQERVSPDTAAFLRAIFEEIAPTPVFISPGNHDWFGPQSLYAHVPWSPNVHIFSEAQLTPIELEEGLTLWGAAHRAPADTANFFEGFSTHEKSGVHLALVHASEQSWWGDMAQTQQPHAPFRAEEIEATGIKHALLGHLHTAKNAPSFTYPGNPDPLGFGELGEVRGAVLVTVHADGSIDRDRRRVAVTEVHDLEIDVTGCISREEIRDRIRGTLSGLDGYVRVCVRGEVEPTVELSPGDLRMDVPGIEAMVIDSAGVRVGYDFDAISKEPTVKGQFVLDVLDAVGVGEEEKRRILVTGLRALDGRSDLEVI